MDTYCACVCFNSITHLVLVYMPPKKTNIPNTIVSNIALKYPSCTNHLCLACAHFGPSHDEITNVEKRIINSSDSWLVLYIGYSEFLRSDDKTTTIAFTSISMTMSIQWQS